MLSALLTSLVLAGASPAPASTVYVQASRLRLRARADASAAVVVEVPIATACTVGSSRGEWVELTCAGKTGFTKAALVGEKAPVLEEQMALATSATATPPDRLVAAQRAQALSPTPTTHALVQKTFFDAEQAWFSTATDLESLVIDCPEKQSTADCIRRELSLKGARVVMDQRGQRFITVVAPAGPQDLFITRVLEEKRVTHFRGQLGVALKVSRMRAPRDALFEEAVLRGGFVGERDPAIVTPLPRAQRDQVAKVPREWIELSGERGARFIETDCDAETPALRFFVGVLGEVSLDHSVGQDSTWTPLESFQVTKIEITFSGDGDTGTIRWPGDEPGVGLIGTTPHGQPERFARRGTDDCGTME